MENSNPRYLALSILNRIEKSEIITDKVIEDILDKNINLSRQDRALLNAIVYGVLRWRGYIDWIISNFSKISFRKIEPSILNILRIGLFQIIFLDRIPVSASVNTSVEMAKSFGATWTVKFVNGVLRNASNKYKDIPEPEFSIKKSFPSWLIKRWLERFGLNQTEVLCDAINRIPPITIRVNKLKTNRDKLIELFDKQAKNISKTKHSEYGVHLYNLIIPIFELDVFKQGYFQVQDEAAQLISIFLAPESGETILDACAGLGGKTAHMAELMGNNGHITAIDRDENKLIKLKSEMDRLGISIVNTFVFDIEKDFINNLPFKKYDRILIDAPCSSIGTIRRNPDIKWKRSKEDLNIFQKKQIFFLSKLSSLLKPSGIIVYAVCSTEIEENQTVIDAFLKEHPEFKIDEKGYLTTSPINNMDGFFSAKLYRKQ
ncbi:MAG: 16S rRNA (cytosine(967)-C(5))-methyltransferase RsmB [Desulfobacterales bacterium]|nr:16S rRNA (cytosine(967)-C(5))-methyltransferase RsmB [Desulfobacterales bacterium]MBF0395713.1 16S rRNA (cytosine(967)-C(5))-methyltransferase RsmB [Desulfobacterales bacterium]